MKSSKERWTRNSTHVKEKWNEPELLMGKRKRQRIAEK
jgi:hypothetical protein